MSAFCDGPGSYWHWQAGAWAGKSALMSSFALNPPPGTVAVAFFVTARYAAQDDSAAFSASVIGQLEELLGSEFPARQGTKNDRARYLLLLREAARGLRARGKRLVLVVDGLDEDRGTDRSLPSIASLLPKHSAHGLKVIVSGRPHPKMPTDVPVDHPLREARIMHTLKAYPDARRIRDAAKLELTGLLKGTEVERDLLGFITAARGGLSEADLQELTHLPPFQVNSVLHSAAGRAFTTRSAIRDADDGDRVYLLAHETLQVEAEREFGDRHLVNYRNRLHALADDYQLRGWPSGTPHYLLRGYFAMLKDTGDIRRLIDCATDVARHDRMLDLTGSDSGALTEISISQEEILDQPDPDLTAMARLAFHQEELAARNVGIPVDLPAVWAVLGQADRAESLAGSLMPAGRKAEALAKVARALALAMQYERAVRVADDAERILQSLASSSGNATACAELAVAFAAVGSRARAEKLIESIADIRLRESTRNRLAAAYMATGLRAQVLELTALITDSAKRSVTVAETMRSLAGNHVNDAGHLLEESGILSRSISDCLKKVEAFTEAVASTATIEIEPSAIEIIAEIADEMREYRIWMPRDEGRELARIASVLARAGLQTKAASLADKAESGKRSDRDSEKVAVAQAETAVAFAACGLHERAEHVARSIADPEQQSEALTRIAVISATTGLDEKAAGLAHDAEMVARSVIPPYRRAEDLAKTARALAHAGFSDQAVSLASSAAVAARLLQDPMWRTFELAESAWALTEAGQKEQAEQLADEAEAASTLITRQRPFVTAWMTAGLAQAGIYEKAEAIARSIQNPWPQDAPSPAYGYRALALAKISVQATKARHRARAARMAADAATLIQLEKDDSSILADAQVAIVQALAASGLHVRAASLADSIADIGERAHAYASMATILMESGSREEAARFAAEAKTAAMSEEDSESRAEAMVEAAEGLASVGLHTDAETLALSIDDARQKAKALTEVVACLASSGLYERAEFLAQTIFEPDMQSSALATLAKALQEASQPLLARQTLAKALKVGPWRMVLDVLGSLAPEALVTIGRLLADERNLSTSNDAKK